MQLQNIGEIAYRVASDTPAEIIAKAGFLPKDETVSAVSNERSAHTGLVPFYLIAEAATLDSAPGAAACKVTPLSRAKPRTHDAAPAPLHEPGTATRLEEYRAEKPLRGKFGRAHQKTATLPKRQEYMYAVPVDKAYPLEGQKQEILAPALPLPEFFVARKILANTQSKVMLGEPEIFGTVPGNFKSDEALRHFMDPKTTEVAIPRDIAPESENYPPLYDMSRYQRHPAGPDGGAKR